MAVFSAIAVGGWLTSVGITSTAIATACCVPGMTMHCVGGAAQHTVVDRAGISIKVLKRWPDVVGKPVTA